MFKPGTVVVVKASASKWEGGFEGIVQAGQPSNIDDVFVKITKGENRAYGTSMVGMTLSYPNSALKVVSKPAPVRFVTRNGETWVGKGHPNTRKEGTVTAVRVAKGDPSGRGGQFHGATNFVEVKA
jgi:hypothetical protein